jgi:hypothetical protein
MAAQPISVTPAREPMRKLTVLPLRRFHPRRYRPGGQGPWSGHLPFAHDVAAAVRPAILVELGTHYGESYFGFCQAAEENSIDCACYAIDTWKGDAHSGFYGEGVFQDVREYNRANYAAFSTLLRSTFDDANPQFADGSIDLLHIDGLHTYDAVKRDFELWLPKVRPGGIVLLHDINVRHADFEVWKFWDVLRDTYESFEFSHAFVLGVIRVPGCSEAAPELLTALFSGSAEDRQAIREHYAFAADYLELSWRNGQGAAAEAPKRFLQVFGDRAGVYMETGSGRAELEPGVWRDYIVELPHGADACELRLDLADCPCIVDVSGVAVRNAGDRTLLFQYARKAELEACACAGDLMPLAGGEHARFLSYGNDPQLLVKAPEGVRLDRPLSVEVSMRVQGNLDAAAPARAPQPEVPNTLDRAIMERTLALNRVETMRAELRHEQTERLALVSEFRRAKAERDTLAGQYDGLKTRLASEQDLRVRLEGEAAVLRLGAARQELQIAQMEAELARQKAEVVAPAPIVERDAETVRERDVLRLTLEDERARRAGMEEQSALLRVDLARLERELGHARARTAELTDDRAYLEARLHDEKALSLSLSLEHERSRKQLERDIAILRAGVERIQAESARAEDMEKATEEVRARLVEERAEWNARRIEMERKHSEAWHAESARLHAAVAAERAGREDVLRSYSWKITGPLRAIFGIFRPRN